MTGQHEQQCDVTARAQRYFCPPFCRNDAARDRRASFAFLSAFRACSRLSKTDLHGALRLLFLLTIQAIMRSTFGISELQRRNTSGVQAARSLAVASISSANEAAGAQTALAIKQHADPLGYDKR